MRNIIKNVGKPGELKMVFPMIVDWPGMGLHPGERLYEWWDILFPGCILFSLTWNRIFCVSTIIWMVWPTSKSISQRRCQRHSLLIEQFKQNHYKWNNLIGNIYNLFNLSSENTYGLQYRTLVVLIVLINHSQNNLLEAVHFVWAFITFIDPYSISISTYYNSLL